MQKVNRLITNICSDNINESHSFYTQLFSFNTTFESDWYIQLSAVDQPLELGIISRTSDLIPQDFQKNPRGIYLTFVVGSADEVYKQALENNYQVISKPEDTFYGQRRLLLTDPDGTLIDVSSLIQ